MIIKSAMRKLLLKLERWTSLVPISVVFFVGFVTQQPLAYYLITTILAFAPALLGMPDPVGEFFDYVGRERKQQKEKLYHRNIVVEHGLAFAQQISEQPADELRLMADCIKNNRIGFNREISDEIVDRLLYRGFVYKANGYTAAGYPFYFYERTWILMKQMQDDIFLAHDSIGYPTVTPKPSPVERFNIFTFFVGICLGLLRLIALLIIGISFGSLTWSIWILLMAAVVAGMVWGGRLFGIMLGI